MRLEEAFDYCSRLARTHYENFTVGSWLLPRDRRQHVYNLYAYARTVDDLGDEAEGDRLQRLRDWENELQGCFNGKAPKHPVLVAVRETIRRFEIPPEPFLKLIEANRMDQSIHRHRTYSDLLHYCDHSANPCGRLFLYAFDIRDPELQALADHTCTALQLTNFWQDVAIDLHKGRIYIPLEDLDRFGVTETDLEAQTVTERFVALMRFEIERTRELFRKGSALTDRLQGRVRVDVGLFTRGGGAILDKIEAAGYDVFRKRPSLSRGEKARLMFRTVLGLKD